MIRTQPPSRLSIQRAHDADGADPPADKPEPVPAGSTQAFGVFMYALGVHLPGRLTQTNQLAARIRRVSARGR